MGVGYREGEGCGGTIQAAEAAAGSAAVGDETRLINALRRGHSQTHASISPQQRRGDTWVTAGERGHQNVTEGLRPAEPRERKGQRRRVACAQSLQQQQRPRRAAGGARLRRRWGGREVVAGRRRRFQGRAPA